MPECALQRGFGHHLGDRPVQHRRLRREQQGVAGEARRQVEVVHGEQHALRAIARQPDQVLQHQHLVMQVQVRHRLVQKQQRRILGNQRRQRHALALAAGKREHIALLESGEIHRAQGSHCELAIVLAFPLPARKIRVASEHHALQHARAERIMKILRQKCALPRRCRHGPIGERSAGEAQRAALRLAQSDRGVQKSGFARAVGAEQTPHFAGIEPKAHPAHQRASTHAQQQI